MVGWGMAGNQLPIFDAESKYRSHSGVGWGEGIGNQLLTFDAEPKSAKIPK